MLGRYQIIRGKRPPDRPLPRGERIDTRKHTRHVLRPDAEMVARFLKHPDERAFAAFARGYHALVLARFEVERARFDALVEQARRAPVYIGCNCPTVAQPRVDWCHTWLALEFIAARYPDLEVRFPERTPT